MVNKVELELGDLQGGILSAYGKIGFPRARYMLFHIDEGSAGRAFVERLRPLVTTDQRGGDRVNPLAAPPAVLAVLARGDVALAERIAAQRAASAVAGTARAAPWCMPPTIRRWRCWRCGCISTCRPTCCPPTMC